VIQRAPAASFDGPYTSTRGQDRSFIFSAADPDPEDAAGPFIYRIQWGDGSPEQVVTGGAASQGVLHTFDELGEYSVTVTAEDPRGRISERAGGTVTVTKFGLQEDPTRPGDTALVLAGTEGNDQIYLRKTGDPQVVIIKIRQRRVAASLQPGHGRQRFVVYGWRRRL
jgi:hypothetical protein